MKIYSLDQVQDEIIGKIGTPKRDRYEYELHMDILGKGNQANPAEAPPDLSISIER